MRMERRLSCYSSAHGIDDVDRPVKLETLETSIEAWPEPKSIRDIQVSIGFANFYRRFIQGFSKIATPLTSMLKTSLATSTQPQMLMVNDETIGGGKSNEKSNKGQRFGGAKLPSLYPIEASVSERVGS